MIHRSSFLRDETRDSYFSSLLWRKSDWCFAKHEMKNRSVSHEKSNCANYIVKFDRTFTHAVYAPSISSLFAHHHEKNLSRVLHISVRLRRETVSEPDILNAVASYDSDYAACTNIYTYSRPLMMTNTQPREVPFAINNVRRQHWSFVKFKWICTRVIRKHIFYHSDNRAALRGISLFAATGLVPRLAAYDVTDFLLTRMTPIYNHQAIRRDCRVRNASH